MTTILVTMVLMMFTALVSFGAGSAIGYKAGRKVTQFQTVKRGAEIVAPYARQLFGEFTATKSNDDWLNNEYI